MHNFAVKRKKNLFDNKDCLKGEEKSNNQNQGLRVDYSPSANLVISGM